MQCQFLTRARTVQSLVFINCLNIFVRKIACWREIDREREKEREMFFFNFFKVTFQLLKLPVRSRNLNSFHYNTC